jgi:hypothetical protein
MSDYLSDSQGVCHGPDDVVKDNDCSTLGKGVCTVCTKT